MEEKNEYTEQSSQQGEAVNAEAEKIQTEAVNAEPEKIQTEAVNAEPEKIQTEAVNFEQKNLQMEYAGYSYQNSTYGNPAYGNSAYGNSAYGNPAYGNPAYGNSAYSYPNYSYGQPVYQGQPFINTSYRNHNINGMEAMYTSQTMSRMAEEHKAAEQMNSADKEKETVISEQTATQEEDLGKQTEKNAEKERRKKNPHTGVGRKTAKLVAAAVIFGLVAGVVFQGVRYGSDALINKNNETNANADTSIDTSKSTPYVEATSNSVQTVYDVADVAEKVMPSIVSITGTYVTTYQYWFATYEQELPGAGSGIIIGRDEENLYILTNYHVVQDAKTLSVFFIDGEAVDATVKGYREDNDVAIILVPLSEIEESTMNQIQEITIGSSEELRVGDPCIAIGNALGYGQSVTVGYISALNREITTDSGSIVDVIQTDAAINPGNSGGALVNMNGELIGVNTAKYVDSTVEGMGYALPITDITDIINDIIASDEVVGNYKSSSDDTNQAVNEIPEGQTYLGISAQTITEEYAQALDMPEGIYISSITEASPAETAGLQAGDIIVGFDGQEVTEMTVLQGLVADSEPGDQVEIEFYRNTDGTYEKQTVTVTLEAK